MDRLVHPGGFRARGSEGIPLLELLDGPRLDTFTFAWGDMKGTGCCCCPLSFLFVPFRFFCLGGGCNAASSALHRFWGPSGRSCSSGMMDASSSSCGRVCLLVLGLSVSSLLRRVKATDELSGTLAFSFQAGPLLTPGDGL